MKLFKVEQVKKINEYCVETLDIPSIVLMENAGVSILKHLDLSKKKFTVVCGIGNNGANGLVVARHLISKNKDVDVFVIGNLNKATKDFLTNKKILDNMKLKLKYITDNNILELIKSLKKADVVVDGILGIGLTGVVEGLHKRVIEEMNTNSKYILGIDLPSGVDGNTGEIKGISILCNKTVTFGCYKEGMIENKVKKSSGEIYLECIGIQESVLDMFHEGIFLSNLECISNLIPKRGIEGHKGNYGKVLIVAGSRGFTGAAYITTQSAVRTGSGLVTLCSDSYTQKVVSNKVMEAMTCDYNLDEKRFIELINSCDCIAVGPGLGNSEHTLELLKLILTVHTGSVVIDADALNVLSKDMEILKLSKAKVIITPHPGEMAKLIKKDISYVNSNRKKVAIELAKKYNIIVLLKGHHTIITDGKKTYINSTGNSAMSSGGMGDCLTGIIISLIGQGIDLIDATILGAYMHGAIADELSDAKYSVQASDIINNISSFMKTLSEKR
ncbi:MAG: NAD(P)H-hydrate dehydratase [Sarcina sp.]